MSNNTIGTALRGLVAARSEPMRLLRGAELAERGFVTDLQVGPGDLRASVSGSRREAYSVKITTPVTGAPPGAGSPIRWSCTCPDWGDPCKHAVAVVLVAAQRFEDDPELVEQFIGSPTNGREHASARASQREDNTDRTSGPLAGVSRSTDLPTVAPLWAEGLGDIEEPTTARLFFGDAVPGGASVTLRSDTALGPDRLRELGPLIVDTYDLAPDIIRMYAGLRES